LALTAVYIQPCSCASFPSCGLFLIVEFTSTTTMPSIRILSVLQKEKKKILIVLARLCGSLLPFFGNFGKTVQAFLPGKPRCPELSLLYSSIFFSFNEHPHLT
jgi:hypothetical protein